VFHSFHNFMKKSVRQVNTIVQEELECVYAASTIIPISVIIVPK
jgi:hypothetical protein